MTLSKRQLIVIGSYCLIAAITTFATALLLFNFSVHGFPWPGAIILLILLAELAAHHWFKAGIRLTLLVIALMVIPISLIYQPTNSYTHIINGKVSNDKTTRFALPPFDKIQSVSLRYQLHGHYVATLPNKHPVIAEVTAPDMQLDIDRDLLPMFATSNDINEVIRHDLIQSILSRYQDYLVHDIGTQPLVWVFDRTQDKSPLKTILGFQWSGTVSINHVHYYPD